MNNCTENIEEIENEASDWFVLKTTSTLTEDQESAFENWLSTSPLHAETYFAFEKIWNDISLLPEDTFSIESLSIEKTGSHEIKPPDNMLEPASFPIWDKLYTWFFPKYAYGALASTCIVFIGLILLFSTSPSHEFSSYVTAKGEISDVILEDGSKVSLSANTQIDVSIERDQRNIKLVKGQAYFDVAPIINDTGERIPFEISSGKMKIEVIGTEFEVHLRNKKAQVTVAEGIVDVGTSKSKKRIRLTEGQQLAIIGKQYDSFGDIVKSDPNTTSSWRKGRLTYRDAYLNEIVDDANRFHNGTITLGHKDLENLRVTTSFRIDQIKEMAFMLEQLLPVKVYEESDNRILILPKRSI